MLHLKTPFKRNDKHNIFVFNIILWLSTFAILLFIFSEKKTPTKIDYIYTSCFIITIFIPVIINLYLLIPRFLIKEKYLQFATLFIVNIIVFTQVNKWFFNSFIDVLFTDYYFISYYSETQLFILFSIFLVATTLIKLTEDWLYLNKTLNEELALKNIEIQTQLSSLRAQINPHFLFNSLNVLYSLSLEEKKETTSAILQLSDILRYVIYETERKKIALKNELILIQKYLDFQKFRYKNVSNVALDIEVDDSSFELYPMLLLPLIENSFKHGIKGEIDNTFINIKVEKNKKEFTFLIENNFSETGEIYDKEYSGVGLKTIRQNLEIIYPNTHSFVIAKTENTFKVSLKISLNEN